MMTLIFGVIMLIDILVDHVIDISIVVSNDVAQPEIFSSLIKEKIQESNELLKLIDNVSRILKI